MGSWVSLSSSTELSMPAMVVPQRSSATSGAETRVLLEEQVTMGSSTYKGYLRGPADFDEKLKAYLTLSDSDPEYAGDFPRDPASWREPVRLMVDAMVNMRGVTDAGKITLGRIKRLSPFESLAQDRRVGVDQSYKRRPDRSSRNRSMGKDLGGPSVHVLPGSISCGPREARIIKGGSQRSV